MATRVEAVANYLGAKASTATGMKLHKLLYYSQAWHLVWHGAPLFEERIEAWALGPVCPTIYRAERQPQLATATLDANATATIDAVLASYGAHSGEWLSELSHREQPWKAARAGLPAHAPSNAEISQVLMRATYAAHQPGGVHRFTDEYMRGLELLVELPEDEASALTDTSGIDATSFLAWQVSGQE